MIPILYEHGETEFLSEGIGRLVDCISCHVYEERNGIFECEFVYPIFGRHYSDIVEGRIIYCTHDETETKQPFDIYAHSAPIDGKVTFFAQHITYRCNKTVAMPFTATSASEAMYKIKANAVIDIPFTFWTDKTTTGNFTLTEPRSIRAILGGQEGSLLDVYGTGEYEWDKFTIRLHASRGVDSGVEIRYGKNLVDINDEVDTGSTYNAVVPYWLPNSDDATIITLPEKLLVYDGNEFIDASGATISGIVPLDLSSQFQSQPTVAQLRDKAKSVLVSSNAWEARQTVEVDFVALWQTEEYKDVAPLQRVRLCDTVSVFYPELGVEAVKKKVVKTDYNVLLDRYDKLELGESSYTYSQVITEGIEGMLEDIPTTSFIEAAISNATNLITGGLGGHVYIKPNADGQPEEILIMDDPDINQAVKIWRWNLGGLGYSNTGYNGTFGTAITMDGSIVANYIATGTMEANRVRTGLLTDEVGRNYWNLTTGEFSLTGYATDSALQSLQSDLETQIDGKINTFYQQADPSTNWTDAEKTSHTGDLWYSTSDGKTLRWDGSNWDEQEVSNAVSNAISSKSTIFYGTTSGTYTGVRTGDYLVDSSTGNTYRWNGSTWVKQTDYNTAITSAIGTLRTDLESQIDGKIDTFYQSSDPSTGWTTAEKTSHTGDLWYKTTDSTTWRWNGTSWQEQEAPDLIFDQIDGKSTIFYGSTSGTYTGVQTGDYLVDSTTGATYRYTGSTWSKVTDYATAISAYDTSLNQQAVFNKLTNNSQNEGVYLSNSHLYVNASMIKTGSMDATLIKAGILKSQDSSQSFSVNMLTGAINMKDATLTGGSLTTSNGLYENVVKDGYIYYYHDDDYIGKVGTSLFTGEKGMMMDIGIDADVGGIAVQYYNESQPAQLAFWYERDDDKFNINKPLTISDGTYGSTLSMDSHGMMVDGNYIVTSDQMGTIYIGQLSGIQITDCSLYPSEIDLSDSMWVDYNGNSFIGYTGTFTAGGKTWTYHCGVLVSVS